MRTWSKEFQRSLQRAAKREILTSPEWTRAYRWTQLKGIVGICCVLLFCLLGAAGLVVVMHEPPSGASKPERGFQLAFHWYATELLFFFGLTLWGRMRNRHGTGWQRLPLTPAAAFALACREFVVPWLVFGSLVGGYVLMLMIRNWTGEWRLDLALAGGLTYTMSVVACGYPLTWLVSAHRSKVKPSGTNPLIGLVMLAVCYGVFFGPWLLASNATEWGISSWFEPLSLMLPGAWAGQFFFDSLEQGQLVFGSHLLPLAGLMASIPFWHRLLCQRFCSFPPDYEFVEVVAEDAPRAQGEPATVQEVREGLAEPDRWFRSGLAERFVGLWLKPAERRLASLTFAGTPSWSRGLRNLHLLVFVALAAGWWLLRDRSRMSVAAAVCCFGVAVLFLLANSIFSSSFGASLGGFVRAPNLPVQLPVEARAFAQVWIKVICLRALLALPLYVIAGLILEASLSRLMWPMTHYLIALWFFGPVLAPVGPALRLLAQAPVTKWRQVLRVPIHFVLLLFAIVSPISCVLIVVKYGLGWAFAAQGIIAVLLVALLAWTTHAFERGWIDVTTKLQSLPVNQRHRQPPLQITIG